MLIHVVDVSHPQFEDHMSVVERTLADIGSDSKPTLVLFNKVDLLRDPEGERSSKICSVAFKNDMKLGHDVLFMSAKTKIGYDELRTLLYERVKSLHVKRYPYNQFLY